MNERENMTTFPCVWFHIQQCVSRAVPSKVVRDDPWRTAIAAHTEHGSSLYSGSQPLRTSCLPMPGSLSVGTQIWLCLLYSTILYRRNTISKLDKLKQHRLYTCLCSLKASLSAAAAIKPKSLRNSSLFVGSTRCRNNWDALKESSLLPQPYQRHTNHNDFNYNSHRNVLKSHVQYL